MGIPLVSDRSHIISAVHALDNLFTPECDMSVLCKGEKDSKTQKTNQPTA